MILCCCNGVSDKQVRLTVLGGASSLEEVGKRCGAGTDCGSCHLAIQNLLLEDPATLAQSAASQPAAAPRSHCSRASMRVPSAPSPYLQRREEAA